MAGHNFITHTIVCCFLMPVSSVVANAQRQHKPHITVQKPLPFHVNDTLPVIGSIAKIGEKQMNKGLVSSALDALSGQAVGVSVVYLSYRRQRPAGHH